MNRYFIGTGARNWNDTANWSETSGGSGGASIPTSSDNVFFDANSGTGTVTVNAEANMLNFTVDSGISAITLSNAVFNFNIYGSITLPPANLTTSFSGTGYLYFRATTTGNTITSGGVTRSWNTVVFNGVGGTWTNQDDWNVGSTTFILNNGHWNTNGCVIVTSSNLYIQAGTKTLTLGGSNFTCFAYIEDQPTGFILTENTSTITCTGVANGICFRGWQSTYNSIVIQPSSGTYANSTITGTSTIKNLTLVGIAVSQSVRLEHGITVTDLFAVNGYNSTTARFMVYSNTLGTPRTLTCNGTITATNCDFRDITFAGTASADFSALEIGDCGGNSGATFRAGENRYYKATSTSTHYFDETKWWSETNGGGDSKTMPLPQDTAIFDANSFLGDTILTIRNARIGSLDMSAVNKNIQVAQLNNYQFYGNLISGNTVSINLTYFFTLMGRGEFFLNTYGKQVASVTVDCVNGSYTLLSNISTYKSAVYSFTLNSGTFDFNDFNVVTYAMLIAGGNVYFGNGQLSVQSTYTSLPPFRHTGGNIYCENSTIKYIATTANGVLYFEGNGKTYYNLWLSGNTVLVYGIKGANTFNNIKIDAGKTVKFTAGTTTTVASITAIGTPSSPITITSGTAAQHTLVKSGGGTVTVENVNLSYSKASTPDTFYAKNSTDLGNNTNWTFQETAVVPLTEIEEKSSEYIANYYVEDIPFEETFSLDPTLSGLGTLQADLTEEQTISNIIVSTINYLSAILSSTEELNTVLGSKNYLQSFYTEIEELQNSLNAKTSIITTFSELETLTSEIHSKVYLAISYLENEDLQTILSSKRFISSNFTESVETLSQITALGYLYASLENTEVLDSVLNALAKLPVPLTETEDLESILSAAAFITSNFTEREYFFFRVFEKVTGISLFSTNILRKSDFAWLMQGSSNFNQYIKGKSKL